jgi:hypothetical protein
MEALAILTKSPGCTDKLQHTDAIVSRIHWKSYLNAMAGDPQSFIGRGDDTTMAPKRV